MTKNAGNSSNWKKKIGWTAEEDQAFPDSRENDLVIVLMGPTGVGKSTFIREYSKANEVLVGHHLRSCTRSIAWYEAPIPDDLLPQLSNRRLILVDTPGFDDTFEDDSEILRRVSAWLARSYNANKILTGVLYMNDISQKRMLGSIVTNFKMFKKLCGHDHYRKVVMGTSQWDTLSREEIGAKREVELKEKFWVDVIAGGARVMRIQHKPEDQIAIVKHLIKSALAADREKEVHIQNEVLEIQKEIVDLERSLPATKAGQELRYTLQELLKLQEIAMKGALDDTQRQEMEQKVESVKTQLKGVKLTFSERLRRFFRIG